MEEIGVIQNGTVITPSKTIRNGVVIFEDGRIITHALRNFTFFRHDL